MDDYLFKVDISDRVTAYVYSIYEEPIDEAVGIFEYHSEVSDVSFEVDGHGVSQKTEDFLLKICKEDLDDALIAYEREILFDL